ncbi:hypothetical protein F4774DRAFT_366180 [Daldinia eschscholtzii]|nr:hypothetical protein F4774DRAFT_366180 [Daldinia eschscholtzii]
MAKVEKPEEGDKVSWNWGGGAPGGTVAETKEKGAIEIKTQRGNTVKRKADTNNPAVRIERSGNDVVKRASELTVEEKRKGRRGSTKRKADGQDPEKDNDEEDEDEGVDVISDGVSEEPHTRNKRGKEVKRGGKEANKKQKREQEEEISEEDEDDDEDIKDTDEDISEEDEEETGNVGGTDNDVESGEPQIDGDVEDGKDTNGETDSVKEKSKSTSKDHGNSDKNKARQQPEKPVTRSQDQAKK